MPSLYIHIPYCLKKCFYCDFNSHTYVNLPQQHYLETLKKELNLKKNLYGINTQIDTIFFGGGTPSLFAPAFFSDLLDFLHQELNLSTNVEITMELNPASSEYHHLPDYKKAGINRISMGVQTFNDNMLKSLGRVHKSRDVYIAYDNLLKAGFTNINIDLMYGLIQQTLDEAMDDLTKAILLNPVHLSWYQLTIEPNTHFYNFKPKVSSGATIAHIEENGYAKLNKANLHRYEISAFAKKGYMCKHNVNYWQFGDYLGLGAGAHSKLTIDGKITRHQNKRQPNSYLTAQNPIVKEHTVDNPLFEFCLNRFRLLNPIPLSQLQQFTQQTRLNKILQKLVSADLVVINSNQEVVLTNLGIKFMDDVISEFLTDNKNANDYGL